MKSPNSLLRQPMKHFPLPTVSIYNILTRKLWFRILFPADRFKWFFLILVFSFLPCRAHQAHHLHPKSHPKPVCFGPLGLHPAVFCSHRLPRSGRHWTGPDPRRPAKSDGHTEVELEGSSYRRDLTYLLLRKGVEEVLVVLQVPSGMPVDVGRESGIC